MHEVQNFGSNGSTPGPGATSKCVLYVDDGFASDRALRDMFLASERRGVVIRCENGPWTPQLVCRGLTVYGNAEISEFLNGQHR